MQYQNYENRTKKQNKWKPQLNHTKLRSNAIIIYICMYVCKSTVKFGFGLRLHKEDTATVFMGILK